MSAANQVRSIYAGLAADVGDEGEADRLLAEGDRLADRVGEEVRTAFTSATRRIYALTAVIIALAAVLTLRIPELPLRTTHDRQEAARARAGSE